MRRGWRPLGGRSGGAGLALLLRLLAHDGPDLTQGLAERDPVRGGPSDSLGSGGQRPEPGAVPGPLHRETAMRQAVTRTQASGAWVRSSLPWRAQARTNASCTAS